MKNFIFSGLVLSLTLATGARAFDLGKAVGWEDIKKGVHHAAGEVGKEVDKDGQAIGKGLEHLDGERQKTIDRWLSDSKGARFFNREDNDAPVPPADQFWMAIVGDSSVTGAVASPNFRVKWFAFLDDARKILDVLLTHHIENDTGMPFPTRVMFDQDEFDQARADHSAHKLDASARISQVIDTAQYSFGYQIGQKLGVPESRIVITGQDGVLVSSLGVQFERILQTKAATLPPLVLVSFVANDLCHPSNFTDPVSEFAKGYEQRLRAQFERIVNNPKLKPSPLGGTRVVFLGPLDVSNILSNPALLNQKIDFENNSQITCSQFHRGEFGGGDDARIIQGLLAQECRGILKDIANPATLQRVRDLQVAQNEILTRVIGEYEARGTGLHFTYAPSTRTIEFKTGDLANDCFHPSRQGALRIADDLITHELKDVPKVVLPK